MVEERMERRLSAILAADIAGYSALMGANESRTVRDLKGHQAVVLPMIGQFAGRIISARAAATGRKANMTIDDAAWRPLVAAMSLTDA